MTPFAWTLLGLVAAPLLVLAFFYNSFIHKRNRAKQAFSTIDVMLKKRCDLVPNLVAAVRAYMQHESDTLARITELRALAVNAENSPERRMEANAELGRRLRGLMIQVENYPDLKADKTFLTLQYSLNEAEEQLAAARRAYNASVTAYNNGIEMVPGNLVAGLFSFSPIPLFEAAADDKALPDVAGLLKP